MAETKIDLEGLQDFEYTTATEGQIESKERKDGKEKNVFDDTDDEVKQQGEKKKGSWFGIFSLEYYQSFFDVTTKEVLHRLLAGILPYPLNLSSAISTFPDLYGPFWLCMTLIFTTALSGNLATLISGNTKWEFHFHEVIVLATIIYSYTWCVPLFLWGFMIWRKTDNRYSLLQLLAIYGYSMAVFVPLTLLWLINLPLLRWLLLFCAILLSGSVLVQALWKPFQNERRNIAMAVMIVALCLHAGIAVGFKFYYFSSALAPELAANVPLHISNTTVVTSAPTNSFRTLQNGSALLG